MKFKNQPLPLLLPRSTHPLNKSTIISRDSPFNFNEACVYICEAVHKNKIRQVINRPQNKNKIEPFSVWKLTEWGLRAYTGHVESIKHFKDKSFVAYRILGMEKLSLWGLWKNWDSRHWTFHKPTDRLGNRVQFRTSTAQYINLATHSITCYTF